MDAELLTDLYGWAGEVTVAAGPRGALGQIWRVDVGPARYALKEIFAEPPTPESIERELAFTRRAAQLGVRVPASHPDRDGRHLVAAPDGTWLRLYDWVDLRPVDLTAQATPAALGSLLARLHRAAPPAGRPSAWYEGVPDISDLFEVVASGAAWAPQLATHLATLPALCAGVTPADPADLVLCHRDLHPENVFTDHTGALVVVDWDDLGSATPARELARALFDWSCDGPPDLGAMAAIYAAYVEEGGPGRITGPGDFTMLLACRLNFLLVQARAALDPDTEPRHREWAEREVDEALRILPTPDQLAAVLAVIGRFRRTTG